MTTQVPDIRSDLIRKKGQTVSLASFHEYYTNYDIHNKSEKFAVINARDDLVNQAMGASEAGWKFKTNLEPDDFEFVMSEAQTKSFLNKMWELYRYRKVR